MVSRFILIAVSSLLLGASYSPVPSAAAAPSDSGARTGARPHDASAPSPATRVLPEVDLSAYLEHAAAGGARAGLAELKRALSLSRGGQPGAATLAFERAATLLPGMADWAHAFAADAAAATGDTSRVRRLLTRTETVLAKEWGWRAVVVSRKVAGDVDAAVAAANEFSQTLEEAGRRAEAARTAGELLLIRHDTVAALEQYRRTIDIAPGSSAALDAARALAALPSTADDQRLIGRVYLRHDHLDRGIAALDRFVAIDAGTAEQRAGARLEIGRALFDARKYGESERRLVPLGNETSHPALAAEALVLAGRAQYKLGRDDAARVSFAIAAERFPREEASAEAMFILGDLEHDAGRIGTAARYYARIIETHPDSEHGAQAAMRLGGIAFAAGDYVRAALTFEEYRAADDVAKRSPQAIFWAARSYLALGDTANGHRRMREARQLDPASYYGMRATELLGVGSWQDALPLSPITSERTRIETTGALRRLDLLSDLGLERAPGFELERLKRYFADREGALYVIAETLHERDQTYAAIRLGRDILRIEGEWNPRLLRIVYPLPYRNAIVREARRRRVDPFLAAGIIRQESLFNPSAKSIAGAIGLMQVMPATGRLLGRKEGMKTVTVRSLRTPATNIRLGMRYLADMLKTYNGHVTFTLAAYNAGPSRVARWRRHAEAADEELFAERIPYPETREYVKIVQQNASIYRGLYGDD